MCVFICVCVCVYVRVLAGHTDGDTPPSASPPEGGLHVNHTQHHGNHMEIILEGAEEHTDRVCLSLSLL